MRRFLIIWMILLIPLLVASAQDGNGRPEPGDPPVASLISVSEPDEAGIVTVSGAPGAVYANAQVAVRNLYTEDIVYTQSGFQGSFTARLYGPGRTPFWVSPAQSFPNALRDQAGSLPGGPGTIVYGTSTLPAPETAPVTQLVMDGDLDDWLAYSGSQLGDSVFALVNQESLYVAIQSDQVPDDYLWLRVTFELDTLVYQLQLDPRLLQTATLQQTAPSERDLGTLAVAAAQDSGIELRIPLASLNTSAEMVILRQVRFVDDDDDEVAAEVVETTVNRVDERNGIVYDEPVAGESTSFFVAGPLSQGASVWTARGQINTLDFEAGDSFVMEMDVTMNVPDLAESLVGLHMIGQLWLQPVIGADGRQVSGGLNSLNGWSALTTPTGLAIDNIRSDFLLGEAVVESQRLVRRGNQLIFGLQFRFDLPADLPPGLYVPFFEGLAQIGDSERFRWDDNVVFGEPGAGLSELPVTRLPLVLNVGQIESARLVWALLYDVPSEGSRGILSDEDAEWAALSNRVRFNSPTYILPPGTYPIEPYMPGQMPNRYDTTAAPLLPLLLPGGRLTAQVTGPSGNVDDLGSLPVAQTVLSTAAVDEKTVFGRFMPVDMARLTTLNPMFTDYIFDQYGEYTISLTGSVEDIWGNRYEGGGAYSLVIAELLDLTPAVLPGTPFETGDVFTPSAHLLPGVPADVTVTLRVYPLDGGETIIQSFEGTASRTGFFQPGGSFRFDVAGEYVVDYEARYTGDDDRLWAASLRAAGVIARAESDLIVHGRRGLDGYEGPRTAWYNAATIPSEILDGHLRPNAPYHQGDVGWVAASAESGLRPVLQVQDTGGQYTEWLLGARPNYANDMGTLQRLAIEDALPLISVLGGPPGLYSPSLLPDLVIHQAYGYVSAVRPDITLRQFIQGSDDPGLLTAWDGNDPFNGQIGAGSGGNRAGDFAFLFGGAVVRNPGFQDAAIYAALAITMDEDANPRVVPPYLGQVGAGNGGPLLTVLGESVEMFFHPTGARPGQVFVQGDTLSISGQVAPPLESTVSVLVISPSGQVTAFEGVANAIGYFYDSSHDLTLNERGRWTVQIQVQHNGQTSAGPIDGPAPTGHVLGTVDGVYSIYVIEPEAPALTWNEGDNIDRSERAGSPVNFTLNIPEGWTDFITHYTVTSAGYVLDSGTLNTAAGRFSYQYNPATFNRDFPFIEFEGQGTGSAGSDVITLTFAVLGSDENDRFNIRTRTFTLMHDRLVSVERVGDGE